MPSPGTGNKGIDSGSRARPGWEGCRLFSNPKPAALLSSTEGFHPGWIAILDGKRVPTVKVNFVFRGVYALTPGNHRLVWEFRPRSLFQGLAVSSSGFLLLFA